MKKKLLYLTSIVLFAASSINAQTSKVWDMSQFSTQTSAVTTNVVVDRLGMYPGSGVTTFGVVATSSTAFTASPDAFSGTYTLKAGGNGISSLALGSSSYLDLNSNFMPDQRFLYFAVTGPCTVKVWFKTSSTGNTRSAILTNGVDFKAFSSTSDRAELVANYTGGAGNLYLFSDTGANYYKIEVIASGTTGLGNTTLATKSFQKELDVTVYAKDGKINLSNIKSSTKVEVYTVLGALVKSTNADVDTSLDINSGVYIVKAKSAEGEKSVKVIVQ
jgi:hypothetical protein